MSQGEIIIYQSEDNSTFHLEVRIENDTVWLNRHQLALLFDRDIKTIGKHINNALKEELKSISVVAKFATTGADKKIYQVEHYNLDMIISIGYRVKSNRGVQFRIWANAILKNYLMKGYAVHQRMELIEKKVYQHDQQIDLLIKTSLPKSEGIFFDGQIFDAWIFVSDLIKTAQHSIVLIDNYIDETTLMLLSKRNKDVTATIFTQKSSPQLKIDIEKYNEQYDMIDIKRFSKSHDRFLIIDHKTVYHIGASLKDLGKRWFAFSKIDINAEFILEKLNSNIKAKP